MGCGISRNVASRQDSVTNRTYPPGGATSEAKKPQSGQDGIGGRFLNVAELSSEEAERSTNLNDASRQDSVTKRPYRTGGATYEEIKPQSGQDGIDGRFLNVAELSPEEAELSKNLSAPLVPCEISARGPLAVDAFNKAIREGETRVMRVPIMFIGQARSGKTSLKKSLKREMFNKEEPSTNLIELEPSYFKLEKETMALGETKMEQSVGSEVSFHNRAAKFMVDEISRKNLSIPEGERNIVSLNSPTRKKSDAKNEILTEPRENITDKTEEQSERIFQTEKETIKKKRMEEVPPITASCFDKIVKESNKEDGEKVFFTLWDFGGQSVYYATHPIFLTRNSIYLLVYDLNKDPHVTADFIEKEGQFERKVDSNCRKTNEDYLHFWLSSVSALESQTTGHSEPESFGKLPLVILVCTHADLVGEAAEEKARKIYGSLQAKPYKEHLFSKYFIVDNTKSGSDDECKNAQNLRNELLALAEKLLQRQTIPINWLRLEEALIDKCKSEEPVQFITLGEAREIARDKCEMVDEKELDTAINFMHDQRIFIHFDETPKLKDMVILDPEWLIHLFREVITVKTYDSSTSEGQVKELWEKLEREGVLDEKLLPVVWKPYNDIKENLIEIMEKFNLLCLLPSDGKEKQYLVPSMLMSPPNDDANKLLSASFISPLFLRFKSPFGKEYVQVPLGLFQRLVIKFIKWCIQEDFTPLYKVMYQNFARFPTRPEGYSVILCCHSSFLQIVLYRDPKTPSHETSDADICDFVLEHLKVMLESLREECFWLNTMQYEFCVTCPVCFKQQTDRYYYRSCKEEESLHFWPESELQSEKKRFCRKDPCVTQETVPVEKFTTWFKSLRKHDKNVKNGDEIVNFFAKDSLVKDNIVDRVQVMEEVAHALDRRICHGKQVIPLLQYWKHLFEEFCKAFPISPKVALNCYLGSGKSPSRLMFENLIAHCPNFSIRDLRDKLGDIQRNDLVKELEQCSLPETATLKDLREKESEAFDRLCLELDHSSNGWRALGKECKIKDETLQQIKTPFSCTKLVLEKLKANNPDLSLQDIGDVLEKMNRKDVRKELELLPGNGTVQTLLDNLEVLERVALLLDRETQGMENWHHFAWNLGLSQDECQAIEINLTKDYPSPTTIMLKFVVEAYPEIKMQDFVRMLVTMKRIDVVKVLKKYCCDSTKAQEVSTEEDTEG